MLIYFILYVMKQNMAQSFMSSQSAHMNYVKMERWKDHYWWLKKAKYKIQIGYRPSKKSILCPIFVLYVSQTNLPLHLAKRFSIDPDFLLYIPIHALHKCILCVGRVWWNSSAPIVSKHQSSPTSQSNHGWPQLRDPSVPPASTAAPVWGLRNLQRCRVSADGSADH